MSKALPTPFYEDAETGMGVDCAGARLLDDSVRSQWASFTGDPTSRYRDEAQRLHPMIVFATAHAQMCQRFGESSTELGIAAVTLRRQVVVGTTIRTTARVIGTRSDADHPTGVVWLQVTSKDDKGVLLSYVHWFRLPKRDATSEIPRNSLPNFEDKLPVNELSTRVGALPQAQNCGGRFFFEDYEISEKIPHTSSVRVTSGDCSRFARGLGMRASQFHTDLPILPMALLMGVGYGLAHEGLELRCGLSGINRLRTPHKVLEGTRLRALTQVTDKHVVSDDLGALRMRLYLFADHLPNSDRPRVHDGERYYPHVALDMDYWEMVPTLKGAGGVARGATRPR